MQRIVLTREELYEEVWSTPMIKLAEKYKFSGNGLKKICKKHDIPVPYVGYWQRLEHGQNPPKTVLPKAENDNNRIVIRVTEPSKDPEVEQSDYLSQMEYEARPENRIIVSNELLRPHHIVRATKIALKDIYKKHKEYTSKYGARPNDYGMMFTSPDYPEAADFRVGPDSFDRALRIADAMFKALEKRGAKIRTTNTQGHWGTFVFVLGQEVEIRIDERSKRHDHVMTPEEEKREAEYKAKGYSWSFVQKYDYKPSGELKLKLDA